MESLNFILICKESVQFEHTWLLIIEIAKDSSGTNRGVGGDLFELVVTNAWTRTTNFEWEPITSATSILSAPIMNTMTDNGDGTYSSTYFVPLDGIVTVLVFLSQVGGAYAEYFENVFMLIYSCKNLNSLLITIGEQDW